MFAARHRVGCIPAPCTQVAVGGFRLWLTVVFPAVVEYDDVLAVRNNLLLRGFSTIVVLTPTNPRIIRFLAQDNAAS